MVDTKDTRITASAFTRAPYVAYSNPLGAASQAQLGVPYLVGNDRYQVIVCADSGTSVSAPAFRYWYAGGAPWGEVIALDTNAPVFHTVDENSAPVMADLELPFHDIRLYRRINIEATIDGVSVEFTPQPLALDPSNTTATIGFSCRVEGYGISGFSTAAGSQSTGVSTSDVWTYSANLSDQTAEPWPNTRTVFVPARLEGRCKVVRAILTDIKLVEINRVRILGKPFEVRDV